jgi:glycosyltransferase involved in cell wall biosynthesis
VAPGFLRDALDSVLRQTRPADEIVVVEDGPLSVEHDDVLDALELRHPAVVRVRLQTNQGAGAANQAGLQVATGEWIAKMDADDISVQGRFAAQLAELERSGADLCGSAMLEFDGDPINVTSRRSAPLDHAAIARKMRWNNPVNHPTAMYRRAVAIDSGGYPDLRLMQDYVLFARMLASGARMTNLSEALVFFRAGAGLHSRRSGRGFFGLEREVQRELQELGLVGRVRAELNFLLRMAYRRLPTHGSRWVHGHVLSRPVATKGRAT